MDLPPEYISSRLTEILLSLQADADRVAISHKNEVLALKEVIEAKDKEIKELKEEVDSYRRTAPLKTIDAQTASFKKITLGKRTPKNVSQFTSDTQMTQSVLLEQKPSKQNQAKTINSQKMENCQSVKSLKSIPFVQHQHPNGRTNNEKQNLKIGAKKPSIPFINGKSERLITNPSASKGAPGSNVKRSGRKDESRSKSRCSQQKRCINVMIPSANFSAYSINASKAKQNAS